MGDQDPELANTANANAEEPIQSPLPKISHSRSSSCSSFYSQDDEQAFTNRADPAVLRNRISSKKVLSKLDVTWTNARPRNIQNATAVWGTLNNSSTEEASVDAHTCTHDQPATSTDGNHGGTTTANNRDALSPKTSEGIKTHRTWNTVGYIAMALALTPQDSDRRGSSSFTGNDEVFDQKDVNNFAGKNDSDNGGKSGDHRVAQETEKLLEHGIVGWKKRDGIFQQGGPPLEDDVFSLPRPVPGQLQQPAPLALQATHHDCIRK
ncbi:uncharacterized protein BCR38DRAFT_486616 [Pseudomassariella vexata]|uniref:Uncharacterized protein n=1 Tax=Pseudomassariella vexata TaxID=1141098 RepID=A0A1Y2DSV3_9PEZI|nr:uncharacterized protein BCR38DRAFT_486616 [Pseudomassariella vexata]ORY62358.1 hypothetical protein BCR38DRAFT_486616 [Pseudomassariella vexata]